MTVIDINYGFHLEYGLGFIVGVTVLLTFVLVGSDAVQDIFK